MKINIKNDSISKSSLGLSIPLSLHTLIHTQRKQHFQIYFHIYYCPLKFEQSPILMTFQ